MQAQIYSQVLCCAYTRACLFFTVTSLASGTPVTRLPHTVLECMSLMGPKQSLYLSAQREFVYAMYVKMKDKDGTQFTLFVNYYSLAPDTTIDTSVHQVFEEKRSLNFNYLFWPPEAIAIVPVSI